MKYKRILLKLSGEALLGKNSYGIDNDRLVDYASEIKQIHKRYTEGKVHTLAEAINLTATSNSTKEPTWSEIIESYREFVPYASNNTWIKSYYCEPKLINNKK